MDYLQTLTPCVNPETAVFPAFDIWWLDLFTSRGIDMPCGYYGALLNLAICGSVLLAMGATLLVWYVWTNSNFGASRSEQSTANRIARMRRKNRLKVAREMYS